MNSLKTKPKHKCVLVPYGDEEMRCIKCGYITWIDKNKSPPKKNFFS